MNDGPAHFRFQGLCLMMNVGLVGCGHMGALRAAALRRVKGARLAAVADLDRTRAERIARAHRCAVHEDWPPLIDRNDIDLVIVSTPNDLHAPIAIAAARAGKHVLTEKPLARNPEEARAMCEAASQHGIVLATGFNHRYYPSVSYARALVQRGDIGEPLFVRGHIGHEAGEAFRKSWMANPSIVGGGTLLDNGVHLLDLARCFLGEVKTASGLLNSPPSATGQEENACAFFEHEQRKFSTLMSSWTEWRGYYFAIEVYGTRGMVRAAYPPLQTVITIRDPRSARAQTCVERFWKLRVLEGLRSYQWMAALTFAEELSALIQAIQEKRPPPSSGHDGLRVVEMVHAIYRSASEGCTILL